MLTIWVIYANTLDYPGVFVVQAQTVGVRGAAVVYGAPIIVGTLELARQVIPQGLYHLPRDPNDDPAIVECWI